MGNSKVHAIYPSGYANTWLIEEEGDFMAVDVGTRRAALSLFHYITERLNLPPERLRIITATHFHFDHVGGIEEISRLCPEASVVFSRRVENYLSGRESLTLPSLHRWVSGLAGIAPRIPRVFEGTFYSLLSPRIAIPLPLIRRYNPLSCRTLCHLCDGSLIETFPEWRVIETPGHTPDSICFYNERIKTLISGDTILNLRGRGELNAFCNDPEAIRRSLDALRKCSIENLYPGHGKPMVGVPNVLQGVSQRGV